MQKLVSVMKNFCIFLKFEFYKVYYLYCRCIYDSQWMFVLGIQWFIVRFLGMFFFFVVNYYSSFDLLNIFIRELWFWNFEKIVILSYLKVLFLLVIFKVWKMYNVILFFN